MLFSVLLFGHLKINAYFDYGYVTTATLILISWAIPASAGPGMLCVLLFASLSSIWKLGQGYGSLEADKW